MAPAGRLTPRVAAARDALAALTGVRYDSVLVNYYADGKCGMRYHADPLVRALGGGAGGGGAREERPARWAEAAG
jgi:hypothetical protein